MNFLLKLLVRNKRFHVFQSVYDEVVMIVTGVRQFLTQLLMEATISGVGDKGKER